MIARIRWGMALGLPVMALGLWGMLIAQEPSRGRGPNNPPPPPGQAPSEHRPEMHRGKPDRGPQRGPDRRNSSSQMPGNRGHWSRQHGPAPFHKGPMPPMMPPFAFKKVEPVAPDKEVEAWIKVLAEKMTDRHDQIRESSRKALVDLGGSAIIPLRELTKSSDSATATAAKNVLKRIEGPSHNFMKMSPAFQGKGQFQIRIEGGKDGSESRRKMEVPLPGAGKANNEIRRPEPAKDAPKEVGNPREGRRPGEQPKAKDQPRPEFRKDAPRGEGPPNPERILANLKLDPEKRKKVEDILFAQQQRMREFMEKNRNASPEERQKLFPQIREMQEGMMKAMREILSEEQLRDLRNQMPGFPGRPNAPFNKGN